MRTEVSISRRDFLKTASLVSATLAFSRGQARPSARTWRERRDLFPEGVASGDPHSDSVLLWTRRPPVKGDASRRLTVEVAEDERFAHVAATAQARLTEASDWTCRVLAAGLKPARVYWYRFTDEQGNGSRIGRTITAPADGDTRPVRFAFVSCQNANQGAQNAYRRMIYEDERAQETDRLGFVLHLGDFIYEIVWYPEDRPHGYYDRRLRDVARYPDGEKITDFHVPTTVGDYRAVYRGYLRDPDLQDARARWPFICMWDNHEYSWLGYQGIQVFGSSVRPAQTRKVAANQAWWEYQPARVKKPTGPSLENTNCRMRCRCAACTWRSGRAHPAPSPRSTCSSATACVRHWSTRDRETPGRPGAVQPRPVAAPVLRRSRRTRLCDRAGDARRAGDRVRLHPAADRPKHVAGWWATALPSIGSGADVEARRAPGARTAPGGRNAHAVDLTRSDAVVD
jgi:hypothetical protein